MRASRFFFWILAATSTVGVLLYAATALSQFVPTPGGRDWLAAGSAAMVAAGYALFAYAIARVRAMGHRQRHLFIALIGTVIGGLATVTWIVLEISSENRFQRVADALVAIAGPATSLGCFG